MHAQFLDRTKFPEKLLHISFTDLEMEVADMNLRGQVVVLCHLLRLLVMVSKQSNWFLVKLLMLSNLAPASNKITSSSNTGSTSPSCTPVLVVIRVFLGSVNVSSVIGNASNASNISS